MRRAAPIALLVLVLVVFFFEARLRRAEPGEEAKAIRALSAIGHAQSAYAATAGNDGYAISLDRLAVPCPGTRGAFLPPGPLTDPTFKAAYDVSLRAKPDGRRIGSDCNGAPTYDGYYATATPRGAGPERRRAFATDETQTIWSDSTGVAPTPPFRERGTVTALR